MAPTLSTARGSIDSDAGSLDQSFVGKALRDTAQKLASELAKRADRLSK